MHHTRSIATIAALLLSIGVSGCLSQQRNPTPAGAGRTVEVEDPALHMTAYRVNVPAGWKFVGTVLRPSGCYGPILPVNGFSYTVLAPDGYTGMGVLPGSSWHWSSSGVNNWGPKCAAIDITSADSFLLNIAVPNMHPDASSVTVVPPTPEMQKGLEEARQRSPPAGAMHRSLDHGRVRIEYKLGEQLMEEMLFVLLDCESANMPAYPMLHRAAVENRTCQVLGVHFWHAPKGKLDALIASKPGFAIVDQQWDHEVAQQMSQAFAQIQKASDDTFRANQRHFAEQTDAMLARGAAFQASQKSSFDHAMAADRANQQAIDHASHLQVLDSLNRQDFIDPSTGRKIETSNQYAHNWISSDKNSVVLNNDPTFDPNGAVDPVRQSWTELIPIN